MYFPFLKDCGNKIGTEENANETSLKSFWPEIHVSNNIEMNINFIKHQFERWKTVRTFPSMNTFLLKQLHWLSKILGLVENTKMDAGFMQRKWLGSYFWYFKSPQNNFWLHDLWIFISKLNTRGDEKNLNTFGFISKEGNLASLQTRRAFLVVNTYSIVFAMDKLKKSVPHIRQIVYKTCRSLPSCNK